jgi:hypothetical protein
MKTIVLDKNILQGIDNENLRKISEQFHLLLTDVLLHEIYTQGIEAADSHSYEELSDLDAVMGRNIHKAIFETQNLWIDRETALYWEAEKGQSAKHAPHFQITKYLPRDMVLNTDTVQEILGNEATHREFVKTKFSPDDHDYERHLKRIQGDKIFEEISDVLSEERLDLFRNGAKDLLCAYRQKKNITLSTSLSPESDWLSYGYVIVSLAYEILKDAGRRIHDPEKVVNAFYDMELLAYMALADGIVTNDKILHKIAWAVWPEKRDGIFSYDRNKGLVQFVQQWIK